MNRYRDIVCPKCGGKERIDFVYPLGWAVRRVTEFDMINDEITFDDDGKYETVDMTKDNTPFGDCPDSFLIHHNEDGTECHAWRELDEYERELSYERRVFQVLRRVYRDWSAAIRTINKHSEYIKLCETENARPEKVAMTIVAMEAEVKL